MHTTPRHVGDKVDATIDRLNAQWNLQLPRLHGREARTAEGERSLARQCSAKIRYLCFRPVNLDRVVDEFETKARQLFSEWVWKPSQQTGTLPVLPVTKSNLARDLRAKFRSGTVTLTDAQRHQLLDHLHSVLNEDYVLARETDAYERKDGPRQAISPAASAGNSSYHTAHETGSPSRRASKPLESLMPSVDEARMKFSSHQPQKRPSDGPETNHKRQQMSPDFLRADPGRPLNNRLASNEEISFETLLSTEPSAVFSSAADHGKSSADISMNESEPDLLPTQEYHDMTEDELFETSFSELFQPPMTLNPIDFGRNLAFKRQALLPSETPFWWAWEVHRLSQHLGTIPLDLNKDFVDHISCNNPPSAEFRSFIINKCQEQHAASPIQSNLPDWLTTKNAYYDEEAERAVCFKANLDWVDGSSDGVFKASLKPIDLDQSCRLQRKFGADRILTLSSPMMSDCPPATMSRLKLDEESLHKAFCEWLGDCAHFIAGRYWRAFFVEHEKGRNRKSPSGSPRLKISMFAETGFDIIPRQLKNLQASKSSKQSHLEISVKDLIEWHLPLAANRGSTDLKGFSRMSLALSKTTPTIMLEPFEFLYAPDVLGALKGDGSQEVMNDGCSRMSLALARDIWTAYGGSGELPSVVQGRISGAKGLWSVDYNDTHPEVGTRGYWIEVSDSQLKIKPHPVERRDADESQRTFEVLKYPSIPKEGHLNKQLISILEDRGVARPVLENALIADTSTFSDSLTEAMKNPTALRLWIQRQPYAHGSGLGRKLGAFPAEHQEQVNCLLDAGFEPDKCAMLIEAITCILAKYLTNYVDKLWIKIPQSTNVFCLADPLGVLRPGQVHLGFSHPFLDPSTNVGVSFLHDRKVLVARNPAYLASDMQLQTAVFDLRLCRFKNVIVFPTQGQKPLASLLSGGDYDGDTVTVIWDPAIVANFQNADLPDLPTEQACGMVSEATPLSEIFQETQTQDSEVNAFLRRCFLFNSSASLMGVCSTEHDKLIYHLSQQRALQKLSHPGAVKLAALAGYLVDANKQGWRLTKPAWYSLRRETSGILTLADPAYKSDKAPWSKDGRFVNVMDFLKFGVAMSRKEIVLSLFDKSFPTKETYDSGLSAQWKYWDQRAKDCPEPATKSATRQLRIKNSQDPNRVVLQELLKGLKKQVNGIRDRWSQETNKPATTSFVKEQKAQKDFTTMVNSFHREFRSIEPPPGDHELVRRYEDEKEHPFSQWSLLKASCLYFACQPFPGKFVWYLAGEQLCFLKACEQGHKQGGLRIVVGSIYQCLKVDGKATERWLERGSGVNEGDENVSFDMNESDETDDDGEL